MKTNDKVQHEADTFVVDKLRNNYALINRKDINNQDDFRVVNADCYRFDEKQQAWVMKPEAQVVKDTGRY